MKGGRRETKIKKRDTKMQRGNRNRQILGKKVKKMRWEKELKRTKAISQWTYCTFLLSLRSEVQHTCKCIVHDSRWCADNWDTMELSEPPPLQSLAKAQDLSGWIMWPVLAQSSP